jgi:hypothetical protein
MKGKVWFIDLRTTYKENFLGKIGRLLETAGLSNTVKEKDLVAVKLHFGELGNTAFIRPVFLRKIVQSVKELGGEPFLTDANTLYAGTRSNAPGHIKTALQNGFAYVVVDAPIVIADGLRGKSETRVVIKQKRFNEVYIASEIVQADSLVSVAHFKGHELAGFGGTLKNLGMGCASRRGKLSQHSSLSPKVIKKMCTGCGDCLVHCPQGAMELVDKKSILDPKKCIGCGECIIVCPSGAVQVRWNQSADVFLENMVEHAMGVVKGKEEKALFVNFITDVTPGCDCHPNNDAPIVRDIGVVASRDPVAVDRASVDLVNHEHALPCSCLETNTEPGEDKFKGVYPKVDWMHQFDYAEEIGLGAKNYELEKI